MKFAPLALALTLAATLAGCSTGDQPTLFRHKATGTLFYCPRPITGTRGPTIGEARADRDRCVDAAKAAGYEVVK